MDPYRKLRPEAPTPADEICRCIGTPSVVLVDRLSPMPIACFECNGEVAPEKLGIAPELAELIASWREFHRAFYRLWLDSAEYEAWAQAQLENRNGPVNVRGRRVVEQLNKYRRTYYWWFQDSESVLRRDCPLCRGSLQQARQFDVCNACSIVVAQP